MFYILVAAISSATFLLQVAVLPQVAIFHVMLNLVVLTSIFFLILIDQNFAITYALVLGFLLDVFSASFFGSFALSLLLVLVVLKRIIDLYFQKENLFSTLFLQVIGIVLFNLFYAGINFVAAEAGFTHATFNLKSFLVEIVPISALWAALFSLILFRFYKKLSSVVQYFQARSRS